MLQSLPPTVNAPASLRCTSRRSSESKARERGPFQQELSILGKGEMSARNIHGNGHEV